MRKTIELLGKPGCGKSTLVNCCTPNPNYIIQRSDLKLSNQERKIVKWLFLNTKSPFKNQLLHNYFNDYPEANELFVRKFVEMHYKLKRGDDRLALLDEGLINRITGIPFDIEIKVNDLFKKLIDEVSKMESLVFDCQCPIDTALERLRSRKRIGDDRIGRYYDENDEVVKNKLRVKQHNIDTALSFYKGTVVTLDMTQPVSTNIKIVRDTIRDFLYRHRLIRKRMEVNVEYSYEINELFQLDEELEPMEPMIN